MLHDDVSSKPLHKSSMLLSTAKQGEIIRLVASACLCVCLFVCVSELSCLRLVASICLSVLARSGRYWYLAFAKYSKRSNETQVNYTLKKHQREFISRSIQNGWAFKIVAVSTGCAIAVDHAFNWMYGKYWLEYRAEYHKFWGLGSFHRLSMNYYYYWWVDSEISELTICAVEKLSRWNAHTTCILFSWYV